MDSISEHVDVAIVGGGINGAGLAFDAVRRGLNVALFEQHDFGFGASTATSKLAHGGLRYLENYQFNLVKESINERNFLLDQASHLVKPLQFYIPIYKDMPWKTWKLRLGLNVYDWMQSHKTLPSHRMLSPKDVTTDIPWIKRDNLLNAASYYDAQMEDHRLIMELLLMSKKEGANIYNYTKVQNLQPKKNGVSMDVSTQNHNVVTTSASSVVLATGAWNNQFSKAPLVKPTKGVHIVLPDMDLPVALLLVHPKDQRIFFVMPWKGHTLIGTTDQKDDQGYDNPTVDAIDTQYLLDGLNHYHHLKKWEQHHIHHAFCGYRPLIQTSESSPSKQSREETYTWLHPNVLAVSGGKYTTYRHMAEHAMNLVHHHVFPDRILTKSRTQQVPFIGKLDIHDWPSETQLNHLSETYHVYRESLIHLIDTYGDLYKQILNTIKNNKDTAVRLDMELPMIVAELQYAIEHEWVKTLSDFMFRRTYYGYLYHKNENMLNTAIHHFKAITGVTTPDDTIRASIQRHMDACTA